MIYFLSDAHLGSRALDNRSAHQQRVLLLLRQMEKDAEKIFLLGDIFDFWMEYFWHDGSKEEYAPVLAQLRYMTNQGIEIHFFIGNHDLWTFGWLHRQTGIIVHKEPLTMHLNGKHVFMAHGDGLVPKQWMDNVLSEMDEKDRKRIRAFLRLRKVFHNPFAQALFRVLPPRWGNHFGYEWARKSRMKELNHPCPYKGENNEELVLWAKEDAAQESASNQRKDYYIFGHRHIDLDLMISSRSRVLILGDLFKTWSYARMDENGNVSLEYFE